MSNIEELQNPEIIDKEISQILEENKKRLEDACNMMNNSPTEHKLEITGRVDKVRNICNMKELLRNMHNEKSLTKMT